MRHGASTYVCAHNDQAASSRHAELNHSTKPVASYITNFSPVDSRILAMLQEWVCQHPVQYINKMRQRLIASH